MNIRHGIYTMYREVQVELISNNSKDFELIFRGGICPFLDFKFQTVDSKGLNVYSKIVSISDVNNSFYVTVKAYYMNVICSVINYKNDFFLLRLLDSIIGRQLGFDEVDRGVYEKYIHRSQVERIWEVRSKSSYDLPIPEGLAEVEEIEF
jgi:hypothetical protein